MLRYTNVDSKKKKENLESAATHDALISAFSCVLFGDSRHIKIVDLDVYTLRTHGLGNLQSRIDGQLK
jgi:hypothetical protein